MFQQSSPASFANSSRNGTPQPTGQSLFAELGDMGGSDEEESLMGTPSRSRFNSQTTTPAHSRPGTAKNTPGHFTAPPPPVPKLPMVDSAMMTEPWEPEQPLPSTPLSAVPLVAGSALAGALVALSRRIPNRFTFPTTSTLPLILSPSLFTSPTTSTLPLILSLNLFTSPTISTLPLILSPSR